MYLNTLHLDLLYHGMKTFKDLEFLLHSAPWHAEVGSTQARLNFDNGYGISVVNLKSQPNDGIFYEAALTDHNGKILHESSLGNEIFFNCTPTSITEVMIKIQKLSPR
jgi:hypothetical protein